MLIDWFTVGAQLINFLILVALLKYFLYGRIVRAIDARERAIAERIHNAEESKAEAEREAEASRSKSRELDEMRDDMVARVKADVAALRQELLAKAREELEDLRSRWRESLRQEQAAFTDELRAQAVTHVFALARRTLRDLAGSDLQQRVIETFIERLGTIDASSTESLRHAAREEPGGLVIRSAFDLPEETRRRLREVVRSRLAFEAPITFETDPTLICGLEVRGAGQKLAWTAADYLDSLERSIAQIFAEEIRSGTSA